MQIEKIKKRTGQIVDFHPLKITAALEKAMLAVRGAASTEVLSSLTEQVASRIVRLFGERIPDVESVQDQVERSLMEAGFYDVARAYILYRERRRAERDTRLAAASHPSDFQRLSVSKRLGHTQTFEPSKLERSIRLAIKGFEGVIDLPSFLKRCKDSIYDQIPSHEITRLAILTARSFIEEDPSYDQIATRLFLGSIYKEILQTKIPSERLFDHLREAFPLRLKQAVSLGRLSPLLLEFDLPKLASHLDFQRDQLLSYRGLQTLYDRYFLQTPSEEHLEGPQSFWMRVSMGLALAEHPKDRTSWALRFYDMISTLRLVPSTPTLFHAGTTHPQLSSCYLTSIEDDLAHIFKSIGDNAQLSKWSGGLGNDWSNVRATGAPIKSTGVESQGVIPFLKIANDTTAAINRSGKRRGATCAYLEFWHLDIEDFLDLRRNTGDERRRTHDMNTAVWIPDLFMKRLLKDETFTLFSPHDTPDLHLTYGQDFEARYEAYEAKADAGHIRLFKRLKASELWRKTITRLFETGHPWITFKDPCNVRSPQDHAGIIRSSNLCCEITLNTSAEECAVCNLSSVNLARHIKDKKLDLPMLGETVSLAMRMLDNVVDINFYPIPEARTSNLKHRPVGLGLMGFQDALYMLDLRFEEAAALAFADESMEAIAYHAILASSKLAAERGPYPSFKGSKWDRGLFPQDTLDLLQRERGLPLPVPRGGKLDWSPVREAVRTHGMRNSNCMAIAPTASISLIANCFPSIEPIYKNLYVKSNMSGDFTVANEYLVNDLKSLGLWNRAVLEELKIHDGDIQQVSSIPSSLKDKYKTAFEIPAEVLLDAAAYRGKWIDQSQSLNLFLETSSGRRIAEVYQYAWQMGLKTTYYLRTLAATHGEKSTVDLARQTSLPPASSSSALSSSSEPQTPSSPGTSVSSPSSSSPSQPSSSSDPQDALSPAVCSLDDPTCESCQ